MHWIEGIFIIGVGAIPWLIAAGSFPKDAHHRARLEQTLPFVRSRRLMQAAAVLLWLFGGVIAVNSLFGLGLPI